MNSKVILISAALLSLSVSHLFADQAQININATVNVQTCTIASDSKEFIVNMQPGNLRESSLGQPFSPSPFQIKLEACPGNISMAHIVFTGTSDSSSPNLIQNVSGVDLSATDIALGIFDSAKNNVDIRNNKTSFMLDPNQSVNTLDFTAAYVTTSSAASAGAVKGFASFEVSYD